MSHAGRIVPVRVADIVLLASEDDYARVHAMGQQYLVGITLSAFERTLDPAMRRQMMHEVRTATAVRNSALVAAAVWLAAACGSVGSPVPPAPQGLARADAPAAHTLTSEPGDLAISDVTVIPMSRDGELAHHTVVIHGDRITAVAPSASIVLSPGTTVIDGAGKWLMPGLADVHVHFWSEDHLAMFVAAGVTTIRNLFGNDQQLALRAQIARGELLGPTIVTAGPIIDGDPPSWPGSAVLTRPDDADRVVAEQRAAGYDFVKVYSGLSRDAYAAVVAAGARHGMAVAGHVPRAVGLTGVLDARQRSIEHLDGWLYALVPGGVALPAYDGTLARMRAALASVDLARLPSLIAATLAAGTWNCPTLIVLERFGALDDVAGIERTVRWLDKVPAAIVAGWQPREDGRLKRFTGGDFATLRQSNAVLAKVFAALVAASAPMLVGTDAGNPFVIPGESLHEEIERMVAAGMPRARVLRAATADAWRYLGRPGEAGVVELGARADLVLLSRDPHHEPIPLVPDGVMLRGRWLPRHELDAMLAEVTRHSAPPADRWREVPPLALGGRVAHQSRYDIASAGVTVAEERVLVVEDGATARGGRRVIGGQQVDDAAHVFAYTLAPDAMTVDGSGRGNEIHLAGKITAGRLVVTGSDRAGRPVSLSERVPAGAFLVGPGPTATIAGALALAERLAGDTRQQLLALRLDTYPAPAITQVHYDVTCRRDTGGRRECAVAMRDPSGASSWELVLDDAGFVVGQARSSPFNVRFTRRP